jgi:hypothetical protein
MADAQALAAKARAKFDLAYPPGGDAFVGGTGPDVGDLKGLKLYDGGTAGA